MSRRCSRNRSSTRLPCVYLSAISACYSILAEVQVKWSFILMDRLDLIIFSTSWMKKLVLHRVAARLYWKFWADHWTSETLLNKIKSCPCCFRVWLKLVSESWIAPASRSFWNNLEFWQMMDLTAWLWQGPNETVRLVFSFCDIRRNWEKGMEFLTSNGCEDE